MTRRILLAMLSLVVPVKGAEAVPTAASGYAVRSIATPDNVQGGVMRRGAAILVGQGAFGAGGERIVRLTEGGPAVTIATGFNSLGGFDLGPDGTLYVVDNGGDVGGATSGDTVYGIPDALNRTTALAAADAELLPSGSIASGQDVVRAADGSLYVSDALGPGLGRVLKVSGGTIVPFVTGLDYTAGIALDGAGALLVGNVDATFAGALTSYPLGGGPATPLAAGLSGIYAVTVDGTGARLVSGGFTSDFTSSTVLALAPAPPYAAMERAHGFNFSAEMFYDAERDETLVLDFGVKAVTAICREQDGDGLCDADDPCTFPVTLDAAKISFGKLGSPNGAAKLAVKGTLVVPTSPAIDPITTGASVRIAGGAGAVLDVAIPPGTFDKAAGTGWKRRKSTFSWKGNVDGVTALKVKVDADRPGSLQFTAAGKNGTWSLAPTDLPLRAVVGLSARSGQCAEVAFVTDACTYNAKRHAAQCKE